jgi:hypothetical protein
MSTLYEDVPENWHAPMRGRTVRILSRTTKLFWWAWGLLRQSIQQKSDERHV